MGDNTEQKGLYDKFDVSRRDGSSEEGGKHEGCRYFVLDLDHDKHVVRALEGYIRSLTLSGEYPELKKDLKEIHSKMIPVFAPRTPHE